MQHLKKTVTTHTHHLKLSAEDVFRLLATNESIPGLSAAASRPNMWIAIPGGGDWANTSLSIEDDRN